MSSAIRYWIGFSITISLACLFGFYSNAFIGSGLISFLTSFIGGGIIGLVGFNLTDRWSNEAQDTL